MAALAATVIAVARPASSATPLRIMPLGDSITAGTGCWRAFLWNKLQTAGHTNIDFVGGVSDGGGCNPGFAYDFDHEGHGGYSATGIADNNQLPPWLAAARPDVILVHLGTNDMWGGWIPLSTKITAFTKLVGQMRADNPNVKIIVAKIIPMSASACATCPADVIAFNNALPAWAAGLTTSQSPIVLADLWTGFDTTTDTGDGVHPNTAGYQKMANSWYPVLAQVLSGVVPTVTPTSAAVTSRAPTSAVVTSRPPTSAVVTSRAPTSAVVTSRAPTSAPVTTAGPTGGGGCTATYKVVSQWGGGFQGEVAVRNNGSAASAAWTATFTYANGQVVSQAWNATVTQSGAAVTARNLSYNGALAAGASATFGFLASWNNATNAVPTVSCVLS
ncbi:cellulose binding domain-containing protein [Luedemannella flava]